jgi:small subunit ribosomal protein S1
MSDQDVTVVEEIAAQSAPPESSSDLPESPALPSISEESVSSDAEAATSAPANEETDLTDDVTIYNLKPRQHLAGKVKNITTFGAFVDIGLPQDGLVHISELSRRKVDKVTDVVSVGQEIEVWVKKVDKKRGRISLTMVKPVRRRLRDIQEDDELEGVVTRLESYGAFVDIDSDREGLVHISQITHDYINHPEETLTVGDKVKVKVLKVNRKKRQVDLSIKALLPPPQPPAPEVKEVEEVVQEKVAEAGEPTEAESAPTAMALAYAAFQDTQTDEVKDKAMLKGKDKRRQEMDAIIARTLAGRD